MGYKISIRGGAGRKSRGWHSVEGGPGTELKKLLAKIGIRPHGDCKCNRRARIMDQRGPDWCKQNLDTIVGWLKEEADERRLPFVARLGRVIIKRAIYNSRK